MLMRWRQQALRQILGIWRGRRQYRSQQGHEQQGNHDDHTGQGQGIG
jgi:hypothetical protein